MIINLKTLKPFLFLFMAAFGVWGAYEVATTSPLVALFLLGVACATLGKNWKKEEQSI